MDAAVTDTETLREESRQLLARLAQAGDYGRLSAADTLLSQAAGITALLAAAVGNSMVDRDLSIDEASDAGSAVVALIGQARELLFPEPAAA